MNWKIKKKSYLDVILSNTLVKFRDTQWTLRSGNRALTKRVTHIETNTTYKHIFFFDQWFWAQEVQNGHKKTSARSEKVTGITGDSIIRSYWMCKKITKNRDFFYSHGAISKIYCSLESDNTQNVWYTSLFQMQNSWGGWSSSVGFTSEHLHL